MGICPYAGANELTVNSGSYNSGFECYDMDLNGLPDWWEAQYSWGGAHDAAGDKDNDGISNLLEYLYGSDPTSYNSGPTVLITSPRSNNIAP